MKIGDRVKLKNTSMYIVASDIGYVHGFVMGLENRGAMILIDNERSPLYFRNAWFELDEGHTMNNTLSFKLKEEIDTIIPDTLSHISVSVNGKEFSIKEEIGLTEVLRYFSSKELFIEYLTEVL